MDEASFESYLISKKIDAPAFKKAEAEKYLELENIFNQVSPNSFTQQKLFLINPLRRVYPMKEEMATPEKKKPVSRPKIMKPKTK